MNALNASLFAVTLSLPLTMIVPRDKSKIWDGFWLWNNLDIAYSPHMSWSTDNDDRSAWYIAVERDKIENAFREVSGVKRDKIVLTLQMRQWWARGGRKVSHRVQTVHSSFSISPFSVVWMSEKSNRLWGSGTVPGSENTALRWDMASKKTIVLNRITWIGAQKLVEETKEARLVGDLCRNARRILLPILQTLQNDPFYHNIVRIDNCHISHD